MRERWLDPFFFFFDDDPKAKRTPRKWTCHLFASERDYSRVNVTVRE